MEKIKINNINVGYEKGKLIIDSLTLNIEDSKITTMIGPNGSGKSTMLKAIMRFLKTSNGNIELDTRDVRTYKIKEFARNVAYVPQTIFYPDATSVFDFIAFGRNPYTTGIGLLKPEDIEAINHAIQVCEIEHIRDADVRSLSGGQQQIVAIALAIAQGADVILLDEPNSYLDIQKVWNVMEIINLINKERKTTILMTLHDINIAARYSDTIVMLDQGKIHATGTPKDVITQENIKVVYHVDIETVVHNGRPHILSYYGEKERTLNKE